jgi:hypothetical protein
MDDNEFRIKFTVTNEVELVLGGEVIAKALDVSLDGLDDTARIDAIVSGIELADEAVFATLVTDHRDEWDESESFELDDVESNNY